MLTQVIAEALNVSAESVRRKLVALGIPRRNNGEGSLDDLTGRTFGGYLVLSRVASKQAGMTRWCCRCSCGVVREVNSNALKSGRALSCGGCRFHSKHKTVGDLSGGYWTNVEHHARLRGIPFNVSQQKAWEQFQQQQGRCALSGEVIVLAKNWSTSKKHLQTASLDRIDSSEGYTEENVQWVHKEINLMKNTLNQQVFVRWCKRVAERN